MNIYNTKIEAIQALKLHLRQCTIDAISDAKTRNVDLTDSQLQIIISTEQNLCAQLIEVEIAKDYDKTIKRLAYTSISLTLTLLIHMLQSNLLTTTQYIREAIATAVVAIVVSNIFYPPSDET